MAAILSLAPAAFAAPFDRVADRVLGQPDFGSAAINFVDARGFRAAPSGLAVDRRVSPNRLFVADGANSRILVWLDAAGFTDGEPADRVIGQPGFHSGDCNRGGLDASSLCRPAGLAIDARGTLFVADTGNGRVLAFDAPLETDFVADRVFGKPDFVSRGCPARPDAASLCEPQEVALDGAGNLYVGDVGHARVLVFDDPSSGDAIADRVFGQPDFETGELCPFFRPPLSPLCRPAGIAFDAAGNLFVSELSTGAVTVFALPLDSRFEPDRILIGAGGPVSSRGLCFGPSDETLCGPADLAFDTDGTLWIADSDRLLAFEAPLATDGRADTVVGAPDFTTIGCNFPTLDASRLCGAFSLAFDASERLYVGDRRPAVVRFSPRDFRPEALLGQREFTTTETNFVDERGLDRPGAVAFDRSATPNHLYLADTGNERILAWRDATGFANGAAADLVIEQADLQAPGCVPPVGVSSLPCGSVGVNDLAVGGDGTLWIADSINHRVLGLCSPFESDRVPDRVLGQPDFSQGECNALGPGGASLCEPSALAVDRAGRLFVADTANHRVLVFSEPLVDSAASAVVGAPDLTTPGCNGPEDFCRPQAIAIDEEDRLFVAESRPDLSRILGYRQPTAGAVRPELVLEGDVASCFAEERSIHFCAAGALATGPDGTLWLADSRRVLGYRSPWTSDDVPDVLLGQPTIGSDVCNPGGVDADSLCSALDLAVDDAGELFVTDSPNHRVLAFDRPAGLPPATAGPGTGTTIGLYDSGAGAFLLRDANAPGIADQAFLFGPPGRPFVPLAGDWNGDGVTTVGIYDPASRNFSGTIFLRESNDAGPADLQFQFGPSDSGWIGIAGDWDGDGVDSVGVYDPASGTVFLRNANAPGPADEAFLYGPPARGWWPLAGDWDGDGIDTIGLYDPATGFFYLRNTNAGGFADLVFQFGPRSAMLWPIAGDWNGDGVDTIGLYDPLQALFALRDTNDAGFADVVVPYGPPGSMLAPIAGNWDGR